MKFIKKFVGLTFVLSMLVMCFMSSTMVAHAFDEPCFGDDYPAPGCSNCEGEEIIATCTSRNLSYNQSQELGYSIDGTVTYKCSKCSRTLATHEQHSHWPGCGTKRLPVVETHTHSYGPTNWGQWSYTNSSYHSRTGTATCTSRPRRSLRLRIMPGTGRANTGHSATPSMNVSVYVLPAAVPSG